MCQSDARFCTSSPDTRTRLECLHLATSRCRLLSLLVVQIVSTNETFSSRQLRSDVYQMSVLGTGGLAFRKERRYFKLRGIYCFGKTYVAVSHSGWPESCEKPQRCFLWSALPLRDGTPAVVHELGGFGAVTDQSPRSTCGLSWPGR